MPRALWKGHITFGFVSIPVSLFPAEKTNDLHFKLVDSRDMSSIHYERVNDETGKDVPWEAVAKAYEFKKGNYVLLEKDELEKVAAENLKLINIEDFIAAKELSSLYFSKPYYLVPGKGGEKGYLLLQEVMKESKKIGIATVIIRMRQHIAAVFPYQHALLLNILHYPQDIINQQEFDLPTHDLKKYKISAKEIEMGKQLVAAMTVKWDPSRYHDEYREAMMKWIHEKMRKHKAPIVSMESKGGKMSMKKGKVVDFMELLKKSVHEKKKHSR